MGGMIQHHAARPGGAGRLHFHAMEPAFAPRAQTVHRLAEELGFAQVGIAPAEPTRFTEHVRRWIDEGRHGDMAYLKDQLEERLDPRHLLPGAAAVICVADAYDPNQAIVDNE